MPRVDVTTTIELSRPIADVANFAIDPDNVSKWYVNIKSVDWKTGPPLLARKSPSWLNSCGDAWHKPTKSSSWCQIKR